MHKALTVGVLLALTPGLSVVGYTQEITGSLPGDQLSYATLYLKGGGALEGRILVSDESTITIDPLSDGGIIIPRHNIKEIKQGRLAGGNVESKEQQYEKPPLSGRRIAEEIIVGCAGGFAVGVPCALAGGAVGASMTYDPDYPDSWFPSLGMIFGAAIGFGISYPLGSATGVYLVGTRGNVTGSFLATWVGTIVGLLCVLPAAMIDYDLAGIAFLAGPPIGATIGFNLTRRYETPAESETALINLRNGQVSLAIPRVYFRPDSSGSGGLSQNVDLLRVRF